MAAIAAAVLVIPSALAVHNTGAFQLDGNALTSDLGSPPSSGADDWDRVCYQAAIDNDGLSATDAAARCGVSHGTTNSTAVSWANDGALNATIFTGGGSKDPQDISNWAWKDNAGGLPDKDNLLHGYAAEYSLTGTNSGGTCPNGTDSAGGTFDPNIPCEVLYFGSDRYDNSGDAQQGFWFFQNKIGLGTNSIGGGSGFTSSGSSASTPTWHRNGDILVISDFSNGGTTSTITVYRWDTSCTKAGATSNDGFPCGDANLATLETSTAANCASAATGDAFCGLVNSGTIAMPWSFTDKSGTPDNGALNGEFYEGGINLSTLGLGNECFSSVASETRSSTSTTATLKDFVLGQFAPCGAGLVTTPKGDTTLSGVGGTATVSDDAAVTVTGITNPPAPTGDVKFYLCGPSTTALSTCSDSTGTLKATVSLSGATQSGNKYTVNSGGVTLNASGYYCWFATWPGDTNYTGGPYTDGSSRECFSITQPTSVSTTLHETDSTGADLGTPNNGTTITIDAGGYVTDYASVTPSSATGTVSFRYYGSLSACTADTTGSGGTGAGSGKALSSGVAKSNSVQFTASGTYYWKAFFTGTGLSLDSASECNEILTVNLPTQVSTTLHETDSTGADLGTPNNGTTITIDAGGYVTDYASVTPQDSYTGTITGSVAFKYYGSAADCAADTNGTAAGGGDVDTSGSAQSDTVQFTASGTYYWKAFFTGTGLNNNSHSDCSEILTVNLPTQVSTTLHETDSTGADLGTPNNGTTITIDAGGYVTDYASVTPQDSYTGTITGSVAFKYYGSAADCAADTNGTAAGGGDVDTSGSAQSDTVQFNAPGDYYWKAFFTGTGLNNNSHSDCSEILTVNQYQPSLNTEQTVKVSDSATISVSGGGDLSGTAHFQPFSDDQCTAGNELADQEDVTVSGGSPQTVSATTTVTFDTAGSHTVYWKVSYTSSNPAQKGIAATCTENTSLTITN